MCIRDRHSSWGGTQIEGWLSHEAMLASSELGEYARRLPGHWPGADSLFEGRLQRRLLGDEAPTAASEAAYTAAGYDFTKWKSSGPALGSWDRKGIGSFRGNGYMARYVEVPSTLADTPSELGLGGNDSRNEVFINGRKVYEGTLKGLRVLPLPAGSWQPGRNTLVIKMGSQVETPWYGLGLTGEPKDVFVREAGRPETALPLNDDWKFRPAFAEPHQYTHASNNFGTILYNAMIAPLVPYGLKGFLWYQGESNAGRAYQYRHSFPLLIEDWRKQWNETLPFYFVQLATFGPYQNSNQGSDWAELREAQALTLALPRTGIAVTTDVGNPADIHPTNKQTVGHRLALLALKNDYGKSDLLAEGPTFTAVKFEPGKAILSFKNTGSTLTVQDRFGYLKGFEVAGPDRVFHYAKANITNASTVEVYLPGGQTPVAVRYAWANAPIDANLFNSSGLPAVPFRTDDYRAITFTQKFN